MIKKVSFKIFVVIIILSTVLFFLSAKIFIKGEASYGNLAIQNKIEEELKRWIIGEESQYYKDINVILIPISIKISDTMVEAVFTTEISQILKATTPEELPAIIGIEKFRDLNSKELSPNKISAVNNELSSWIKELNVYIGKTETLNIDFKVIANISEDRSILPETVNFFISTAQGDFYRIDNLVPSEDQMETEGFNHAKEIADKANNIIPNNFVVDTYRRCDLDHPPLPQPNDPPNTCYYTQYNDYYNYAANYADSFALSYNTAYHSCSNDCANFVSQAMYAGGIPMDSIPPGATQQWLVTHWWCNPPNSPMDYSPWVWTTPVSQNYYTGLKNYMINNSHWESSNITWANAGSIIMWKDISDYPGHIAMVVQNDTINRALSQHNTDRRHYAYTTTGYYSYSCDFYTVHNYVLY